MSERTDKQLTRDGWKLEEEEDESKTIVEAFGSGEGDEQGSRGMKI